MSVGAGYRLRYTLKLNCALKIIGIIMWIEITYKTNIYEHRENGKPKLIKRNVMMKEEILSEQIESVRLYRTIKGDIDPKKCVIVHEKFGTMNVDMPYEDMKLLRKRGDQTIVKGFIQNKEKSKLIKKTNNGKQK